MRVDDGLDYLSADDRWDYGEGAIGNRKPYALGRHGHSSILCRRRAPVANPSRGVGLLTIYGFGRSTEGGGGVVEVHGQWHEPRGRPRRRLTR